MAKEHNAHLSLYVQFISFSSISLSCWIITHIHAYKCKHKYTSQRERERKKEREKEKKESQQTHFSASLPNSVMRSHSSSSSRSGRLCGGMRVRYAPISREPLRMLLSWSICAFGDVRFSISALFYCYFFYLVCVCGGGGVIGLSWLKYVD